MNNYNNDDVQTNSSPSSYNSASISPAAQDVDPNRRNTNSTYALSFEQSRHWQDVFWLAVCIVHLGGLGLLLVVLGLNRFMKNDRLNIDKYTYVSLENHHDRTEYYWPLYAVAGGVGTFLGWTWLLLLGSQVDHMMKVSVHILTTYLAVISIFCFWAKQYFWGSAFAVGAFMQFLYVISVIDRS